MQAILDRPRTAKWANGLKSKFEEMLFSIDARPRVLVDRECGILWRSDRAAKLLRPPIPLWIEEDRLTAATATASTELCEFVRSAGSECSSHLVRTEGRHWAMALAWSLDSEWDAVCLLINLSVPHRSVAESGLAQALRLTGTETRVLDLFARLYSPREISDRLGTSLSTVRSHLKQIYSKAGVDSAVQLTQLVRGYCSC